jgi:creatinine amidohydrolase
MEAIMHSRTVLLVILMMLAASVVAHAGHYEMMRPGEIQAAVDQGQPLLIPIGVLEYHGPQNPIGLDALICQGIADRVQKEIPCVVTPTFFFNATGSWAGGLREGEIELDGPTIYQFAKPILKAFFAQGWKRIYIILAHQGWNSVTGTAWQMAAGEVVLEHAREKAGPGWFDKMDVVGEDLWQRIQCVYPSQFAKSGYGGHGGKGETSAMLSLYPETVDLKALEGQANLPRWAADANEATAEQGDAVTQAIVAGWVKEIQKLGQPK